MRIEYVLIAVAIALGLLGYLAFRTASQAPDRSIPTAQQSAPPVQAPAQQ